MTGWRVGWISGPVDVIGAITKLHESTTSCVTTLSQYAAIAALQGPHDPVESMRRSFRNRRDFVFKHVESIPHISLNEPRGAFYAFIDVSSFEGTSMDIAKRLLHDYGVVTALGLAFGEGGEGYIRLSFANNLDRLDIGLNRIEEMVQAELDN